MKSITVEYWYEIPKNYTGCVKYTSGEQYWYKDGQYHREDGPAIIYPDGNQYWMLNDKHYSKEGYYRKLYKLGKITEQELFIELL